MKRKWWLVGCIAVALLVTCWVATRDNTPVYEGKTARQWFFQYVDSSSFGLNDDVEHLEAKLALRQIGAPAVALLLDEAAHPRPDTAFSEIMHQLRRTLFQRNLGPYVNGTNTATAAQFALKDVRPPLDSMLPLIQDGLDNVQNTNAHLLALWSLGCAGDGAERGVPYLTNALASTNPIVSSIAAQSLSYLGAKAKGALPAIIAHLDDPWGYQTLHATLASLGPDATAALPLLNAKLNAADHAANHVATSHDLLVAASAAFAIDPGQTNALHILRAAFADTNESTSGYVLWLARALGPRGRALAPEIVRLAEDPDNGQQHTSAIYTLESVSPQAASRILRSDMQGKEMGRRLWAAGWILRIDAKDHDATEFLMQQAQDASLQVAWTLYALEQLRYASAENKEVVALLSKLTTAPDLQLQNRARQSLKYMRLKPLDREP